MTKETKSNGTIYAHRNQRLRRSRPRFSLEHPGALQILATACCDRVTADGTGRLALIYVDEDGGTSRTSFATSARCRAASPMVLKADGLVRGDRVAVFLSQSLEVPIRAIWRHFVSGHGVGFRCLRCSARMRWNSGCRIPAPKRSSPDEDRLGKAREDSRTGFRISDIIYVIGGQARRPAAGAVLALAQIGVG